MIVHTAVRKKVPLKKKVRSNNVNKKSGGSKSHPSIPVKPQLPALKSSGSAGTSIKPVQTIVTTTISSPNTVVTTTQNPTKRANNVLDNSKKFLKKKKRSNGSSSPNVMLNDSDANKQAPDLVPVKPKKYKKSKHKQEIIDYSAASENHTNTFGKVQKWLMDNPLGASTPSPAPQINHTAHITKIMSKSISTPEKLTQQRSPKKAKVKTKSVGNLNEKVRLQVVYKPPFKFSLKLSKNETKTQVVNGVRSKPGTRKGRIGDVKRVGPNSREETQKGPTQKRRSAILIRSAVDPIPSSPPELPRNIEPTYETLNPKSKDAPAYENLQLSTNKSNLTGPINTATFRISKSASGGVLMPSNISNATPSPPMIIPNSNKNLPSSSHNSSSFNKYNGNKGSVNNMNQLFGHNRRLSLSNAPSNLSKQCSSSSQNLMRSSTTNLTKANRNSFHMKPHNYELSRSSTTNLTKAQRHHGSQANLRRDSNDDLPSYGRSRKNSTASRHNISRTSSTTNLTKNSSRHHGSINNIPRANIIGKISPAHDISRQISMQSSKTNTPRIDYQYQIRPHTAACDDPKTFEWPKSLSLERKLKDEPLPSDLEVMLSDVENVMHDR